MMGNPSEKDYKGVVSNHLISNCPITVNDIDNSRAIHGPALASVRGKTVRRTPAAPVVTDYEVVPHSLIEQHKMITLAADVFFVDGTAFLMTVSHRIKFITSEHVPVRTAKSLAKHIDRVVLVYARAGFTVRTILMDGEFEKIKDLVPRLECNTTAAKEHVRSEAEWGIRTIKERVRGLVTTLPFEHIPRRMKIKFVYFCVLWLNAFPVKSSISSAHSPRELLVHWKLDYTRHCRVLPGTYCEVHDEPSPSNTMAPRTHAAIALGPTGNMQGSVKFYCLTTGRVLRRRSFTPLAMPDRVIQRVNTIGQRERQGRTFRFLNRKREPYEWTDTVPEDDPEFQGLLEEPAPYPDVSAELPGVLLEDETADMDLQVVTDDPEPDFAELAAAALDNAGINAASRLEAAHHAPAPDAGPAFIEADDDDIVYEITFDYPDAGLGAPNVVPGNAPPLEDTTVHDLATETVNLLTDTDDSPWRYPTRLRRSVNRYSPHATFLQLGEVRMHRSVIDARKYAMATREERIHATTWAGTTVLQDNTEHIVDKQLVTNSEDKLKIWAYVMTQYNLKPGLRKFGARGATAAVDELTQLHIMDTWTAMDPSKISREERRQALSSLLFLKEKCTGKIKGRACINGAPQRAYIPKEEAASPTVSTESTFITAAIAAHEHRRVQCFNIPSAFVNTDVDKDVLMVLKGELADMMVQIAPQVYRKYVTVDKKGTPVLYVKLQKALYGLMRSSLLFYRKLQNELEAYGFEVNPYDPCVANKTTESGKQMTFIWHVDDLMGLCEDDFELTKLTCYLARIYGSKLTMHTGQKHDYLGVDMEFRKDGTLGVSMIPYLKNVIAEFPELITGKSPTPAADHLFKIRDEKEAKLLEEERALVFHHTVAQLLFMATRARRDIQTAVAFLTTRVKNPDKDDWGTLKRVLRYLNGKRYLTLNLSVDNLGVLKWFVDGSHNVHWDCKGHGGAMFTLGKGAATSYSQKIKLNTRSSTKTELVAADMYMPEMLWTLYFIQSQGYGAECIGLYQDNMSTQLLMKNGRFLSGKKTKHIKAKFFFIKDKVDDGEMRIIDCPTETMWVDVLTKPLQGMAFKKMRAELMNCSIDYIEDTEDEMCTPSKSLSDEEKIPSRTPQECVGGTTVLQRTTDRRVGVNRIGRRSAPPAQRKGRE